MARAPTYFRLSDGKPVTAEEATERGILKDGYGQRSGMFLSDGITPAPSLVPDTTASTMTIDHPSVIARGDAMAAQNRYERRITDAWRGPAPSPHIEIGGLPFALRAAPPSADLEQAARQRAAQQGISLPQARFETRLANAWR